MNKKTIFVFVIGAPRSGTTWLYRMISEHCEIYSLNGSNTFLHKYMFPLMERYDREKKLFADRGFTRGLPSKIDKDEFENLISDYITRFYDFLPETQKYYVEKATDITSEIHKIKKFIQNSKFVHIIRDGRNATISEIKLRKRYGAPMGTRDLFSGSIQWKKQIIEARQNSSQFSSDVYEVKYEDLFKNTKYHLKKIFNHIGLMIENSELDRICNKYDYKSNTVSMPTSSVAQDNGELHNAFITEMSKSDQALFEYLAGDVLKILDYPMQNLLDNRIILFFILYVRIPFQKMINIINRARIYLKLKRFC